MTTATTGLLLVLLCSWNLVQAQELPYSPEAARYWDDAERARVVQHRRYEKSAHHALGVTAGVVPMDDLFTYFPVGLRYDFFFLESIGVELRGEYMPAAGTKLRGKLSSTNSWLKVMPRYEQLKWNAGLNGLWFPMYGKFALLGSTLSHVDLGIMAGVGVMGGTRHERKTMAVTGGAASGSEVYRWTDRATIYGDVGILALFYLSRRFVLRVEYVQFLYQAAGDNLFLPGEFTLGCMFFLTPLDAVR